MPELPAWLHKAIFITLGACQGLSLFYFSHYSNLPGIFISATITLGSLVIFRLQEEAD